MQMLYYRTFYCTMWHVPMVNKAPAPYKTHECHCIPYTFPNPVQQQKYYSTKRRNISIRPRLSFYSPFWELWEFWLPQRTT